MFRQHRRHCRWYFDPGCSQNDLLKQSLALSIRFLQQFLTSSLSLQSLHTSKLVSAMQSVDLPLPLDILYVQSVSCVSVMLVYMVSNKVVISSVSMPSCMCLKCSESAYWAISPLSTLVSTSIKLTGFDFLHILLIFLNIRQPSLLPYCVLIICSIPLTN